MHTIVTNYFDGELFAKYGLTEAEQKFIESIIKPIEPSGTFRGSLNF